MGRPIAASICFGNLSKGFLLVVAATGCTQETAQPTRDCASLLAQFDQRVHAAGAEQVNTAMAARAIGEKLCLEGKTKDGAAKLNEAISQIPGGRPDASGPQG
jgi:hypothetical protein